MAVNDLMMRIQLLADTGKSTAELNRLQQQLKALTNQLKSLEQTSLTPLTNDLKTIKAAQSDLKATNLQTFAKTLDDVKKSFSALSLPTTGVDSLKKGYEDLEKQIKQVSVATNKHKQDTAALNDRLLETKKNQLTGDGQSINQQWVDANDSLKRYSNGIKLANEYIREERQWIAGLKNDLRNVNSLYAQQRASLGQDSLPTLTRKTEFDTTNLNLWKDTLNSAKSDVVKFKDELKQAQITSKSITLKNGIADALADSNSQLAKLTAQQRIYNKDLLDSKTNLTGLKNTLSEIRDSNKISVINGNDIRSIATIKSGLRDLKTQQKDALKLQFDPTPIQLFDKLVTRANATSRKIVPKFDAASITSLEDYNKQLSKQQQNVLRTQGVVKNYQSTLRALRLELQTVGTPNFDRRNGNLLNDVLRIKKEIQSINSSKGIRIEVDDKGIQRFVGGSLTSLQNKFREIKNTANISEAFKIAPVNAQVKAYNAEFDVLKQINNAYKENNKAKEISGVNSDAYKNSLKDIQRLEQALVKLNPNASAYTGDQALIQRRMTQLEQESALGKLKSSLIQQDNVKYQQQGAELSKLIDQQKNQIALKNDEKKAIENLIASERTRARLAANDVKTRNGGLFDTVASKNTAQNEVDLYRGNVAALKQYLSTLKQVAQAKGDAYSGRVSTLSNELLAALGLESAQKRLIANEQRLSEIARSNLRTNKSSREAEIQSIQAVVEANKRDNLVTQEGIKSRIANRQQDISNIQGTIASVKQRIEVDKQALTAYKEGLNAYREGIQQQIFEAQQRIASGQLTKQQYNEERTSIRASIAEQKELSKAYQQQLRDRQESLNLALKAEKASATALKNQVKDLMNLRTEEARSKAVDLTRQYQQSQTSQGSLRQQISESESLARAEIQRSAALAQSAKAAAKAKTDIIGFNSAFGSALKPVKEFGAALGFMFGPQMAGFAVAGTVMGLTSAFIEANKQVEQLIRGLNAISGGNGQNEFKYLVDISNKLGVSIGESAHSFLQLEATTAGTAIEGAKTKQIFESFARALNVTGADAVTFNRAFRAVSQSLSKGQLYAEELKGQLAEALPGAIQVFAKAIDVTPKKFLAMVKAGQFAGQTLYDLYGLVANQLDKTYKVGSEKDFTFVQKSNLAKNAFVGLSVELGKTGIWKALSDGMLYLRDTIVDTTKEVNNLSAVFQSIFRQNATIVSDIIKELNGALGTELTFDNVGFDFSGLVRNFRVFFQALPDVVRQEMQPVEDAFAEFDITKAFKDFVPNIRLLMQQLGIVLAAFNQKQGIENPFKDQLKAMTPEIERIEKRINALRPSSDYVAISQDDKNEIDQLSSQLVELKQKQEEVTAAAKKWKTMKREGSGGEGFISTKDLAQFGVISSEIDRLTAKAEAIKTANSLFGVWFSDDEKAKFDAVQKQIDVLTSKKANIELRLNDQQLNGVITQTETLNSALDDVSQKRDLSIGMRELNREQIRMEGVLQKYADSAAGRARDNQKSAEETIAVKERDIAITKNQLAYEKKILDIKQEQRDAQVGFAKARYQEWVKSGSMTQESADFLIKSAENMSALKAIRDAQDAVEAYNVEVAKGDGASTEELKLLREKALELLKLGSEKAKQTANEYKYNQLVEERIKLLGSEKDKTNEGADAVYRAKVKADNPQATVDEAAKPLQVAANNTPITYKAIIKPEIESNPSQQSGLMFASFRQDYQQTQQVLSNPLRFVVDDAQVNSALQGLNSYQSKIQDIRTQSLPDGKTEIIVTPKINEQALQEGFRFIKTSAEQSVATTAIKPIVDKPAVEQVKKTAEEVKKQVLSILDKDGKQVNFIVSATGITKTSEEMQRLAAQKEIPVTAFTDQKSLDDTKKKFDETGSYIKDGLRGATTIAPQGIQNTLDTAFGKGKYKLEIVPTLVGGVTEDGWIKNNEIKRNLIITPVEGDTSAINGMIQQQTDNVKSGFDDAWQKLREFDAKNQTVIESTPIDKQARLDTTVALEEDALLVAQLSNTVTKYVDIIYRSSGSDGAAVKAATGGYLSGYGGGDRIHALLEAGEFILRKEAVRKLGLNNVFALNNLDIPKPSRSVDKMSIPSFSSGGYVGSSNTININVPGSKSIQVSGSRESAMALANLLTRVGRAA